VVESFSDGYHVGSVIAEKRNCMRPVEQLVHSRTRVCSNHALMPLEGFPVSRLPGWPDAAVKVLASPALGAGFVQYLIDLPAGKSGSFAADSAIETFCLVISGNGICENNPATTGSFALVPPGMEFHVKSTGPMSLIILRKRYEPAPGIEMYQPIFGNESQVEKKIWADNPHSLLQTLIPDELQYDLAMNIFTFDPGHGLPIVETHVMEHGLWFMQGKGMYFLGERWMEVEANDFIWMGPYCPQSFYATGPMASRYLYYKNVNRVICP
jgi:(S)-ureidoglycine aminohydrolase